MASKYEQFPGMTTEERILFDILREIEILNSGGTGTVSSVNGQTGVVSLNTDNIPEGLTNLYFTENGVLDTPLTGYIVGTNAPISATNTVLTAFQDIQAQLNAVGVVAGAVNQVQYNNGAGGFAAEAAFTYNPSTNTMNVERATIGTALLTAGQNAFSITATQPAVPVATQLAVRYSITSAGSASFTNAGMLVEYLAGYTGSSATFAFSADNRALGTGATLIPAAGSNSSITNVGAGGGSSGTTTGYNVGVRGFGSDAVVNAGVFGLSQAATNNATNMGVVGSAINTGTSGVSIGGFFSLNQTAIPTVSAAGIFDNGTTGSSIFLARNNGSTIVTMNSSGQQITPGTLTDGASALAITATQPTVITGTQSALLYNITSAGSSSQANLALRINYLAGYTGSASTNAAAFQNSVLGTGSTLIPVAGNNATVGNFGANAVSLGTTTGLNIGFHGAGSGGDVSAGVIGLAQIDKAGAINIGVTGSAVNTTGVAVGGFFSLNRTTLPVTTSALTADNGTQAADIFRADDNGTNVFAIKNGGSISLANLPGSSGQVIVNQGTGTPPLWTDFSTASALPEVGNIITEGWTSLANWTLVGSGITAAGGTLTLAGGTPASPTFTNYIRNTGYGNTQYMHWEALFNITVGTINATSWGVAFGIQSQNTFTQASPHIAIMLDSTNKGKIRLYRNNINTVLGESSGTLTVSAGNVLSVKITRIYNQMICTVTNTSLSPNDSITYAISQFEMAALVGSSLVMSANMGQFAVYALGGTHTATPLAVNSLQKIGSDVLLIGDSITAGVVTNNESNTYGHILQENLNGYVDIYAGGGDRIQDIIVNEILTLAPKKIFILLGTNNIADGDSAATLATRLATFIASLTGYTKGTNLFFGEILPKGVSDVTSFNAQLKTTNGTTGLVYLYNALKDSSSTAMNPIFVGADGTHPTINGNQRIADVILTQTNFSRRNNPSPYSMSPQFINGKLILTNDNLTAPNHMLEVVDRTGQAQIRIGYSKARDGGFIHSNASNQLDNLAGYYIDSAGSNIAAETSGSGILQNAGAVSIVTFSGATVGSSVSPVTKLALSNTGAVSLTPGTLADTVNGFSFTATMPTTITATNNAVLYNITSAGSSSFGNRGVLINYLAGYTGSSATVGIQAVNTAAGTGANLATGLNNLGVGGSSTATTTGYNVGTRGLASGGNINAGLLGIAVTAKNSATNIGGVFYGNNSGTSPVQIGVYAGLNTADPTFVSSALLVDNSSTTSPIGLFRDNGTIVYSIDDVTSTIKSTKNDIQNTTTTTNNTLTTIHTIATTSNETYEVELFIVGRRTGGSSGTANDTSSYHYIGHFTNKAGTLTKTVEAKTPSAEDNVNTDVTGTISGTNILIQVQGDTNNNYTWATNGNYKTLRIT